MARATILNPRFKRVHFSSARAVSKVITKLSDIRAGQFSADLSINTTFSETQNSLTSESESLLAATISKNAINLASQSNRIPDEFKQFLRMIDAPNLSRKENSMEAAVAPGPRARSSDVSAVVHCIGDGCFLQCSE